MNRWVGVITLIALATAAEARAQSTQVPQGGKVSRLSRSAPELQITQVRPVALAGTTSTEIEIRWTVLVPRPTTINDFEVLLEAHYSDGVRGSARVGHLRPSARATLLRLASHPRQNSAAVLRTFKASVKVNFTVTASSTVAEELSLIGGTFNAQTTDLPGSNQLEVAITGARTVSQGCSQGHHCVDVTWKAAALRNIAIREFNIRVDAILKDGSRITDITTVAAAERTARVETPAESEVNSLRVTLLTTFLLHHSITTTTSGTFPENTKG